jgi:hypothetical protein
LFANLYILEPKPREDLKKIARTRVIKLREFEEVKKTGPLRNNLQSRSRFTLDESSSSSEEEVPQPKMSREEARAHQFETMRKKREEKEEEKKAKKQRDIENISRAPNNLKALFDDLNKIALRDQ